MKRYYDVPAIELPALELPATPLAAALEARLSCRRFTGGAIELPALATLLGSAFGCGERVAVEGLPGGGLIERPLPSAGACYPLEIYLLARAITGVPAGVHHYDAEGHRLEQIRGPLPWGRVASVFQSQPYVAGAAAVVAITASLGRTLPRYGFLRGSRFVLIEAGHLGQNVYLAAAALELGCLALGGVDENALAALLDVEPATEPPVYCLALGLPASRDRGHARDVVPSSP